MIPTNHFISIKLPLPMAVPIIPRVQAWCVLPSENAAERFMARIFTKTGDKGETGCCDGTRVPKNDPLIEVNGAIDECNSLIGVARSFNTDRELDATLREFQSRLMTAGSEVTNTGRNGRPPRIAQEHIQAMEKKIDQLEEELPRLTRFILPAGGKVSAHLHLARTASRKVERRLVALQQTADINAVLLVYFNRLSDILFVLARHAAKRTGKGDEPGVDSSKET
jgi:cob(I)alamin adenosyltransferase